MKGSSGAVKFLLRGVVVFVFVLMGVGQAKAVSISFIQRPASLVNIQPTGWAPQILAQGSEYALVKGSYLGSTSVIDLAVAGLRQSPGGPLSRVVGVAWLDRLEVVVGFLSPSRLPAERLPAEFHNYSGLASALTSFTCSIGPCFDESVGPQTVINDLHGLNVSVQFDAAVPIPEPPSLLLLGSGLTALGIFWRRRQRN